MVVVDCSIGRRLASLRLAVVIWFGFSLVWLSLVYFVVVYFVDLLLVSIVDSCWCLWW